MKNVSEFQALFKLSNMYKSKYVLWLQSFEIIFLCHYKYNKAVSCVQKKATKYLHLAYGVIKGNCL